MKCSLMIDRPRLFSLMISLVLKPLTDLMYDVDSSVFWWELAPCIGTVLSCWATSKECQYNSGCAWPARVLGADGLCQVDPHECQEPQVPSTILHCREVAGVTYFNCQWVECCGWAVYESSMLTCHSIHWYSTCSAHCNKEEEENNILVTFECCTSCRYPAGSSQHPTPPSSYSQLITLIILITIKQ